MRKWWGAIIAGGPLILEEWWGGREAWIASGRKEDYCCLRTRLQGIHISNIATFLNFCFTNKNWKKTTVLQVFADFCEFMPFVFMTFCRILCDSGCHNGWRGGGSSFVAHGPSRPSMVLFTIPGLQFPGAISALRVVGGNFWVIFAPESIAGVVGGNPLQSIFEFEFSRGI